MYRRAGAGDCQRVCRKIVIHTPDLSDGKQRQNVEFFFNFADEVEIPVLAEPLITESTLKRRKRRNLYGHTVFCSTRKTMVSYNR